MRARASNSDDHHRYDELWPGERIGPPSAGTRGKAILRGVIILVTLGGGWALFSNQTILPEWLLGKLAAVSSAMKNTAPELVESRASTVTATSPSVRVGSTTTPVAPDASQPATTAALPQAATPYDEAPTRQSDDHADPNQKRAEAVGLHPGLSPVLLARLSLTDYRNAGIAIRTALAETPDSGVFVWPRQRAPELALFQVRFVQGAAPGCRRYVVTVTKDRWLTTALPMEKCGSQVSQTRRG